MEHKMGVIRTLTHRADTIISDSQDKEREMKHLKKVLSEEKDDQTTHPEHGQ